jgi:hypothetical protein
VLVHLRHPEPIDGLSLEVELDQHRRLVTHDPPLVSRFDDDELRSYEFQGAAICVLNMDLAADQETDVRMHAEIRADDWLHISGPAESGRVDHSLDTARAGSHYINLDTTDFAVVAAF